MNELGRWQTENDLTDEQMAALMSERLGRAITPHGVHTITRRKNPPALWLEALELAPKGEVPPDEPSRTRAPFKPSVDVLPFEPLAARAQIVMMYTFAGKGAAQALRSPDVEAVWAGHAPQIADAYIEWAKQSPKVAQVIAAVTLGGPAGQVVLLHGSLVVSTLIVSGRISGLGLVPPPMRPTEVPPDQPEEELDGFQPVDETPAAANGSDVHSRERPVRPLE